MKIIFKTQTNHIIRNFDKCQEVLIRPSTKRVKVFDKDSGLVSEVFEYIKDDGAHMETIPTTGNREVFLTIIVGKQIYDDDAYNPEDNVLSKKEVNRDNTKDLSIIEVMDN